MKLALDICLIAGLSFAAVTWYGFVNGQMGPTAPVIGSVAAVAAWCIWSDNR